MVPVPAKLVLSLTIYVVAATAAGFGGVVPLAASVAAGGAAALLWYVIGRPRELRRAWEAGGLCVRCGYDLRSSPTRCPECGLANPKSIWPRLASGSTVPIE